MSRDTSKSLDRLGSENVKADSYRGTAPPGPQRVTEF